jgi:hypothetical protein
MAARIKMTPDDGTAALSSAHALQAACCPQLFHLFLCSLYIKGSSFAAGLQGTPIIVLL